MQKKLIEFIGAKQYELFTKKQQTTAELFQEWEDRARPLKKVISVLENRISKQREKKATLELTMRNAAMAQDSLVELYERPELIINYTELTNSLAKKEKSYRQKIAEQHELNLDHSLRFVFSFAEKFNAAARIKEIVQFYNMNKTHLANLHTVHKELKKAENDVNVASKAIYISENKIMLNKFFTFGLTDRSTKESIQEADRAIQEVASRIRIIKTRLPGKFVWLEEFISKTAKNRTGSTYEQRLEKLLGQKPEKLDHLELMRRQTELINELSELKNEIRSALAKTRENLDKAEKREATLDHDMYLMIQSLLERIHDKYLLKNKFTAEQVNMFYYIDRLFAKEN